MCINKTYFLKERKTPCKINKINQCDPVLSLSIASRILDTKRINDCRRAFRGTQFSSSCNYLPLPFHTLRRVRRTHNRL